MKHAFGKALDNKHKKALSVSISVGHGPSAAVMPHAAVKPASKADNDGLAPEVEDKAEEDAESTREEQIEELLGNQVDAVDHDNNLDGKAHNKMKAELSALKLKKKK